MTVSLVFQKAELRKYSDDQPRDEHGRWAGGYVGVPASAAKPGEEPGINGRVSQPGGSPVRGKVISPDDPRIGPYVYHVTPNGQQVQQSGVLKAGGAGGLGGDQQDKIVSFTTDPKIADQLQQDMRLVTNLSNALPPEPDHPTWNDETKTWDDTDNHADWSRQLVPMLQAEAQRQGVNWSEGARMGTMDFVLKDYGLNEWTNSFFNARESQTQTPNPLFFGLKQSDWQGKDPSNIKVFAVPRDNLKTGALLTNLDLGSPYGLQEIRSYGDVPVTGAVIKYDPSQPRDEGGKWTSDGGGGDATPYQKKLPMNLPAPEQHVSPSRRESDWLYDHRNDNPELRQMFDHWSQNFELTRSQYDGLHEMIGNDLKPTASEEQARWLEEEERREEEDPTEEPVQDGVPPAALAKFGAMTKAFSDAGGSIVPIDERNFDQVQADFEDTRDRIDGDRDPNDPPDAGVRLMNAAISGGPYDPDVVTQLAAYDSHGFLVGAMLGEHGSNEDGNNYVHVGAIGSTREVAGAGTALEHSMAEEAASENAYIYGEPLYNAVPYHVSIGRAPIDPQTGQHNPGELVGNEPGGWTADEVQQIARAA